MERLRALDPEAAKRCEAKIASGASVAPTTDDADEADARAAQVAAAPALLAVGLGLVNDIDRAADMVGLSSLRNADPEGWAAIVEVCEREHKGLKKGDPGALGSAIYAAVARLAFRALAYADRISPGQAASAAKSLAQVAEMVQGDAKKVHTQINLTVGGKVVVRPEDIEE
mgnify:CR=1 FL=1